SVQRVTDIMAEISAASQEQAAGIEQVNQTITQMDETTQQNAALVEEASAAARAMEEQAGALATAISVFQIEMNGRRPTAAPLPLAGEGGVRAGAEGGARTAAKPKPTPKKTPAPVAETDWAEF
ncbi:methyl-accepting chemotaxis protein, partial [Luteimonas sp. XNQY3]|nr:methyl-accepting chemotaxis protein [Luteimonas sp. XNQY3]